MTIGLLGLPWPIRSTPPKSFVVRELAIAPRAHCGVMVGACLAVSGAIFQGLVRNPLVSPDIIGVNAGASRRGGVSGSSRALLPTDATRRIPGRFGCRRRGLYPDLEKRHLRPTA